MVPDSRASVPVATSLGAPLPPGVAERFLEAGGIRYRCLQGGAKEGLPVVLLHGWPTWAEVWIPVAQAIGTRHPWIAPDLPCQGRSSLLPPGDRTMSAYRRAIGAFLDALGLPRFAVVGNSMGGSLAIMAALDRPSPVERIAVLDAAGLNAKFPGRTARMYLPFVLRCSFGAPGPRAVHKLLTKAVFHDPRFADDAWVRATVGAFGARDRRKALVGTGLALRRSDASVYADLPNLRTPTLILSGREDLQFTWQSAEAAARRVPGARFTAIDGAAHFPMVEKPEETASLLSAFLDSDSGE